ncbi:MAG: hypothetical protein ACRDHO_14820, partial [Actinomycetota bacterium]
MSPNRSSMSGGAQYLHVFHRTLQVRAVLGERLDDPAAVLLPLGFPRALAELVWTELGEAQRHVLALGR